MNWVGGARNRLRFSNERKIQKEFFERKKFNAKAGSRHKLTTSNRKHSEDLKAIHIVSNMHSDTFTFPEQRRPLKIVDLDKYRSKSSVLPSNIDLGPSSPMKTPSKLQLMEASHHKQFARKVDRSPFDDEFFYPKSSQKHSRGSSTDDNDHPLNTSQQIINSQKQFKIPDIPNRTYTPSSEVALTEENRKIWNRKLTDEMFKHSSLPNKNHKRTFEPYNQSYRRIPHHDFNKDLFEMNVRNDQSKTSRNQDAHKPTQDIPFVCKSTQINPTGNMFLAEDFQMTPIRKYQVEKNPIPNLGLSHLKGNVELSDLSDAEIPKIVERKSRIFQGEDFLQTPLNNEMFTTPTKTSFCRSSQSISNNVTLEEPVPIKGQGEEKETTRYLTEAHFQTPLYKFTPRTQVQPVVSIEESHNMLAAHQNANRESSEQIHLPLGCQESPFITTLHDFREPTPESSKIPHSTESEMASFPETTILQNSPKESASVSVLDNQTEKDEEVDKKQYGTTHGKENLLTEILDEIQELEKQDKMDEWMMADDYDSSQQKESCIDQIDEEEFLFQSLEEVKQTMNDMLTKVVCDCSDDFEFDHQNSFTDVQCSQQMTQIPEGTMKETHFQCPDENSSHENYFSEVTTSEHSSTDCQGEIKKICDVSTSTIDVETCDKSTQYSPKMYNAPVPPLNELLYGSLSYNQFSVQPIHHGSGKGKTEQSNLDYGTGSSEEVETTYCLRSRKKI